MLLCDHVHKNHRCAFVLCPEVGLPADLKLTGGKKIPVKNVYNEEDPRLVTRLQEGITTQRGKIEGLRGGNYYSCVEAR